MEQALSVPEPGTLSLAIFGLVLSGFISMYRVARA
ncbi:MAG: PEP-CTERM sorting domain-containing protein [Planctomycetes bacterium]|nr:PEP-CTERM sorting domain-containing protein [Planctomycetota bacterium]